MKVFTPTTSSWLILLILTSPVALIGCAALIYGSIYGAACIALAVVVVLYNGSARLVVSNSEIKLRRYCRDVWVIPADGTMIKDGLAGDVRFMPAFIFWREGREVGCILKGWFSPRVIDELRQHLS